MFAKNENGETRFVSEGDAAPAGWTTMTAQELAELDMQHRRAEALARTQFTKIEIRTAFASLGIETTLDSLLESNPTFKTYWLEAQIIDLEYPLTVTALASLTAEQIQTLKLAAVGLS